MIHSILVNATYFFDAYRKWAVAAEARCSDGVAIFALMLLVETTRATVVNPILRTLKELNGVAPLRVRITIE